MWMDGHVKFQRTSSTLPSTEGTSLNLAYYYLYLHLTRLEILSLLRCACTACSQQHTCRRSKRAGTWAGAVTCRLVRHEARRYLVMLLVPHHLGDLSSTHEVRCTNVQRMGGGRYMIDEELRMLIPTSSQTPLLPLPIHSTCHLP